MKPSKKFLQKVSDGHVGRHAAYSEKRGVHDVFYGGELTAWKHADAGYITMPDYPRIMHTSLARLTDKGRAVLDAEKGSE